MMYFKCSNWPLVVKQTSTECQPQIIIIHGDDEDDDILLLFHASMALLNEEVIIRT